MSEPMTIKNPAPDASPPRVPTGQYAIIYAASVVTPRATTEPMTPEREAAIRRTLSDPDVKWMQGSGTWINYSEDLMNELDRVRAENFRLAAMSCLCVSGDDYGNAYCSMKQRAEKAEADLAAVKESLTSAEREKFAAWMIRNGFITGHGDTFDDLLGEFDAQWKEADKWSR